MKKTIALVLSAAAVLALFAGCGASHTHDFLPADCLKPAACECGATEGEALGHSFKEATCTAAKTCEHCGTAEGEALGHKLSEATYQAAPVCSVCEETVGEKLQADFEKYGISKFLTEGQTGTFNTVNGNGTNSPVSVTAVKYEIQKSVDEHRTEREGYEWHTVTFRCDITDAAALQTGFNISYCYTDYYTIKAFRDSADHTDPMFSKLTVNFDGKEVPVWLSRTGGYERNDDGSVVFNYKVTVQKPIGYDGIVVGLNNGKYNLSVDPVYFNEVYSESDFALFRLNGK